MTITLSTGLLNVSSVSCFKSRLDKLRSGQDRSQNQDIITYLFCNSRFSDVAQNYSFIVSHCIHHNIIVDGSCNQNGMS